MFFKFVNALKIVYNGQNKNNKYGKKIQQCNIVFYIQINDLKVFIVSKTLYNQHNKMIVSFPKK